MYKWAHIVLTCSVQGQLYTHTHTYIIHKHMYAHINISILIFYIKFFSNIWEIIHIMVLYLYILSGYLQLNILYKITLHSVNLAPIKFFNKTITYSNFVNYVLSSMSVSVIFPSYLGSILGQFFSWHFSFLINKSFVTLFGTCFRSSNVIFPLLLKDNFTGYKVLVTQSFFSFFLSF